MCACLTQIIESVCVCVCVYWRIQIQDHVVWDILLGRDVTLICCNCDSRANSRVNLEWDITNGLKT